ncbi:hypothetical protein [Lentzea flaviverrucosa]|uniref:Uncharacterized protein n=1 Tax=Lentzea flaviverrucosa TaxID=200379 RepID=A0A1H9WV40_9PSEU|nr:hypothetical protein [Lentzea flaviverrucosa]RDI23127.1 hypothetical protein DFR72_111258 [Lentzea flaviverrucosa]SES37694.1 hypothetical protein SAMN05216195_112252 [Lentzea flaviverrucosa]
MRRLPALMVAMVLALGGAALSAVPASADKTLDDRSYCTVGDSDVNGWEWRNGNSCMTPDGATDGIVTAACPSGMRCGSYSISGLGSRKQQVRSAGGNVLDLAVAMLETERMNTNYPYGDNKRDDAANFGIFKQNWYMLRSKCDRFRGQTTSQWNNGAALNSTLSADISCLHQSQNAYGMTVWFGGHRNGQTGINNPHTSDINGYKTAIYWIRDQLNSNSANLSNDTRFWVDVRPI